MEQGGNAVPSVNIVSASSRTLFVGAGRRVRVQTERSRARAQRSSAVTGEVARQRRGAPGSWRGTLTESTHASTHSGRCRQGAAPQHRTRAELSRELPRDSEVQRAYAGLRKGARVRASRERTRRKAAGPLTLHVVTRSRSWE